MEDTAESESALPCNYQRSSWVASGRGPRGGGPGPGLVGIVRNVAGPRPAPTLWGWWVARSPRRPCVAHLVRPHLGSGTWGPPNRSGVAPILSCPARPTQCIVTCTVTVPTCSAATVYGLHATSASVCLFTVKMYLRERPPHAPRYRVAAFVLRHTIADNDIPSC